jgi:hypothetical protein
MGFIMPSCLKHKRLGIITLLFSLSSQQVCSAEFAASIPHVNITLQGSNHELNADIVYRLSPIAKEALENGIPLNWSVHIKIQQAGIFYDTTITESILSYQMQNHALLNLYSVEQAEPSSKNMFSSLTAALNYMSTLRNFHLIDQRLLKSGIKYLVAIRIQFNRETLPTPLRPMSYFNPQWALSSPWTLWQLQN